MVTGSEQKQPVHTQIFAEFWKRVCVDATAFVSPVNIVNDAQNDDVKVRSTREHIIGIGKS